MDFAFTEAQTAVAGLARKIFEERLTPAALKTAEASPEGFDRDLWRVLGSAGLLGTAVPEAHGGAGHGFLELCALLEQAGAAVAPLPIWPTAVLGALPIAKFGTGEQRARFLDCRFASTDHAGCRPRRAPRATRGCSTASRRASRPWPSRSACWSPPPLGRIASVCSSWTRASRA